MNNNKLFGNATIIGIVSKCLKLLKSTEIVTKWLATVINSSKLLPDYLNLLKNYLQTRTWYVSHMLDIWIENVYHGRRLYGIMS